MAGAIELKDAASSNRVSVSSSGSLNVTGYVTTSEIVSPLVTGQYMGPVIGVTGAVGATNHVSLTNPAGSGKTVQVVRFVVSPYTVGVVGAAVSSLVLYRASNVSGGTVVTPAKADTAYGPSAAVLRTNSPTATLGDAVAGIGPLITDKAGGTSGNTEMLVAPLGGGIKLSPGESLVASTTAGDTDQRWNFLFGWGEL